MQIPSMMLDQLIPPNMEENVSDNPKSFKPNNDDEYKYWITEEREAAYRGGSEGASE